MTEQKRRLQQKSKKNRDVCEAQNTRGARRPNPVLRERKARNFAARLRLRLG
jgi:hypothetical protein